MKSLLSHTTLQIVVAFLMKFNLANFKKVLFSSLLIFFAVGVFVGGRFLKHFNYIKNPQVLSILSYHFFLPAELIREIESEYNLKINFESAETITELEEKLRDPKTKFDLVSLFSFQALQLDEEARLQPINWSLIKKQENISNDFMSLGGDELAKKLFPLAWGINAVVYDTKKFAPGLASWEEILSQLGPKDRVLLFEIPMSIFNLSQVSEQLKLKTKSPHKIPNDQNFKILINNLMRFSDLYHIRDKNTVSFDKYVAYEMLLSDLRRTQLDERFKLLLPREGALFWTLNLAEPRFAPHPKEIAVFLNALLEKQSALEILTYNHLATTNRSLDSENIEASLKAQYIREVPLTSLKFQNSFPDANIFSQLINQIQKSKSLSQ